MVFNKKSLAGQAGQASKLLLVLAAVVLVAVVIVFLVMRMAEKPPKTVVTVEPIQLPVYEQTLGNIRFIFQSALDKGGVLKASEIVKTQYTSSQQKDLPISNTGAKFIKVTIGAQNRGTIFTEQNAWKVSNIVDSENREFVPLEGYKVNPWLSSPDLCGAVLQPAFDPTPCIKIYEVSKESTGLKIRVETGRDNKSSNLSSGKKDTFLLDLIVR